MEIQVINIGNSKGIRLPKAILDQYNIHESLEMILEKRRIVLKPKLVPRKNWDIAFKQMNANGEDKLLIDDVFEDEVFEDENVEEWK